MTEGLVVSNRASNKDSNILGIVRDSILYFKTLELGRFASGSSKFQIHKEQRVNGGCKNVHEYSHITCNLLFNKLVTGK